MYKHIVYTFFIVVFIIACKPTPPPPPPPPPPVPDTAQKLAEEVYHDLQLKTKIPTAKEVVTDTVREKMKKELRKHQQSLSKEVNGEDALALIRHAIDSRIAQCEDSASWTHVLVLIELHLILKPGSKRHIITQEIAMVQLRKPVVTIKGFLNDITTNRKKAVLEFFLPLENKTYFESMMVGEQLHGLKFEQIIGDNQGIIFFYVDADKRFNVFRKSATE